MTKSKVSSLAFWILTVLLDLHCVLGMVYPRRGTCICATWLSGGIVSCGTFGSEAFGRAGAVDPSSARTC